MNKGKQRYGSDESPGYGELDKVQNPGDVDEYKWAEAKKAAEKEYGEGHWGAVSYIYEKLGGKFHRKS
jgi:hypothetical protein